MVKNED